MFKKLNLQFSFFNQDWPESKYHSVLGIPHSSYIREHLKAYLVIENGGELGLDLQSLLVSHCWALRHVVSMHFGWLHWQLVSFWDSWEIFASAPKALVLSTNSFSLTDCQQAFPCGIVTSDGIVYLMPCRTAILIFSKHLSRDASTINIHILLGLLLCYLLINLKYVLVILLCCWDDSWDVSHCHKEERRCHCSGHLVHL